MNWPLVVFWLVYSHVVCGLLAYGALFANQQREFPQIAESEKFGDRVLSIVLGSFGVLGFIAVIFMSELFKHGFKWR